MFFPIVRFAYDSPKEPLGYAEGKRFCSSCPVKGKCLEWAMRWETDNTKRFGLFGGFSPGERSDVTRLGKMFLPKEQSVDEFEVTEC